METKSENVVVDVVALSTALHEVEDLSEHHWVSTLDGELARNEANYTAACCWLAIKGIDFVAYLTEAAQFSVNGFLAHELLAFEGQHRLVGEEVHQVLSGTVEGRIEVVYELGSYLSEIRHFLIV